ncbi:MAG TPA: hypothetical protein VGS27_14110 [Candidatus Sulfotelmatobacter sp.]|nr:hypothetical protein [Candidatus Sulfotelmatobacter sp.]
MLKRFCIQSVTAALLFSALGMVAAVRPAQASPVQITLNNLTFGSSLGYGSEIFNGSFLYDPTSNTISGVNISATGATDSFLGGALDFLGVEITGFEPFEFAFDDGSGFGDALVLNLASGLSASSYGFADATLFPSALGSLGFVDEYASSGSFSVNANGATPTPEPDSLLLLFTGMLLLCLGRFVRQHHEVARRE